MAAKAKPTERTYESVWEDLSSVDCSEHIQKKMNLSYLSWAWAWGILMTKYADAKLVWVDGVRGYEDGIRIHPDDSVTVLCEIRIPTGSGSGSDSPDLVREMWLPVMDHKNNAIKNPDSRKISDAKMRCKVKALALFGLAHYIYAGEDLPNDPERENKIEALIASIRTEARGLNAAKALTAAHKKAAKSAIEGRDPDVLSKVLDTLRKASAEAAASDEKED